jgi:tetratricopeptide (TPR) repeat protein
MTLTCTLRNLAKHGGLAAIAAAALVGASGPAAADAADCKAGGGAPPEARIAACDAALAQQTDPKQRAELLFARAYAKNEKEKYQDALVDLNEAVRLDPSNASALHERAYTLSSLMRYEEAIADIDAQLRLTPDSASGYQERAYSDHHLARFESALDDLEHVVRLKPDDARALVARASAKIWLGRFDQAAADLDRAGTLARDESTSKWADDVRRKLKLMTETTPGGASEAICDAVWEKGDFDRPHLVGDCTAAFLQGKTPAKRAAALTARAQAWRLGQQDMDSEMDDKEMAAAIEPDNPNWLSNLGFACVDRHHSWAAKKLFDRSIQLKPSFAAYAGRAEAKFNLGDMDGAYQDAKKSFEMHPNDIALTVLGDIALDHFHDPKAAKGYWMAAYRLGDRDDGLIARLKRVGVTDPDKEPPEPAGSR